MGKTYSLPINTKVFPFCNLLFDAAHLLIGGTTGSGKSVTIDDYLYNILATRYPNPDDENGVQLALIDPKKVSLSKYRDIPHTVGYVTENPEIVFLLDRVISEMDDRYSKMQTQNLTLYQGGYLIIVIDELADLMTTCKRDIMPRLQRIAQLGRAAKIKIVCATQCPNRKVIPAELTVNFTGRLALRCLSAIESKQVIGRNGAESLPQYGKGLYLHSDGKYYECNIPKIDDAEITRIIDCWKAQKDVTEVRFLDVSAQKNIADNFEQGYAKFQKRWELLVFGVMLIVATILFIMNYIK